MPNFKLLTISIIIFSFFIVIGAGHGIGCLGLLEMAGLAHKFEIGTDDFSLSLTEPYDKSIDAASFFALVGHMLLILSILAKDYKQIFWTKIIGLIFLWMSFYYLTHNLFDNDLYEDYLPHNIFDNNLSEIGFVTGLPFLIVSIILAFKIVKQKYQSVYG